MALLHRPLRRLVPVVAVAAALGLSGCIPTTWLPDSSGFVYVKTAKVKNPGDPVKTQLVHFDLKTKASRVLADGLPPDTVWPAVSPDGKRIAVARFKGAGAEARTIQVVFYDMQGKEVAQSREFAWVAAAPEKKTSNALLFWSPTDDRVVVTDNTSTGIIDVGKDSMKLLDKATPVLYNGTPIRPDGKGFVAILGEDKERHLAFVDWAGAGQKIDTGALEALMPKDDKAKGTSLGILDSLYVMPLMTQSWWDGAAAVAGAKRQQVGWQVDTAKKTTSLKFGLGAINKEALAGPGGNAPVVFEVGKDVTVRVVQFKAEGGVRTFNKVTAVNHKTGKEETLAEKASQYQMGLLSPDGRHLALCLGTLPGVADDAMILVINDQGELHAKITFEP